MKKEEVQVSKIVNMNLNQADLIEVMIEDLKESLELRYDALTKHSKDILKKMEEVRAKALVEIGKLTMPEVKKAEKAFKAMGLSVEVHVNPIGDEEVKRFEYKVFQDQTGGRGYRGAYDYEKSCYQASLRISKPTQYSVTIEEDGSKGAKSFYIAHFVTKSDRIAPNPKLDKFTQEQIDLGAEVVKIYDEICAVKIDLHKLEFGEKRFKAKFVKASLGKSEEGKAILDMMTSVKGGMKLLS